MNLVADLNAAEATIETMERLVARQQATLLRLAALGASPALLAAALRLLTQMKLTLAVVRRRRADLATRLTSARGEVLATTQIGLTPAWCTVEDLPMFLAQQG